MTLQETADPNQRIFTPVDVDNIAAYHLLPAHQSFEYFRVLIRPHMLISWWTKEIAPHLKSSTTI